jgi:hypothetical protein
MRRTWLDEWRESVKNRLDFGADFVEEWQYSRWALIARRASKRRADSVRLHWLPAISMTNS